MEDDTEPVKCLFCDDCFSGGAANVLQHCEAIHRFSFSEIKHKYGKTFLFSRTFLHLVII